MKCFQTNLLVEYGPQYVVFRVQKPTQFPHRYETEVEPDILL